MSKIAIWTAHIGKMILISTLLGMVMNEVDSGNHAKILDFTQTVNDSVKY